jgi:hypothetical protein
MISKSPQRNTFQKENYIKRQAEEGKTPENDESTRAMLEYYDSWDLEEEKREADPVWQKNNLEWDLRTTDWILEKVRNEEHYAQNLYAAICNNDFIKREMWPILKEQKWSCSWRYAGGIVSHMRQEGDYIDWYCSGIRNEVSDEEYRAMSKEQQERYLYYRNNFVSESVVTEEIENDLYKLGWIVVKDNDYT